MSSLVGGGCGALLGWLLSLRLAESPKDVSFMLLRFAAVLVGFVAGGMLGGGVGILIARKKARDEAEEEVL